MRRAIRKRRGGVRLLERFEQHQRLARDFLAQYGATACDHDVFLAEPCVACKMMHLMKRHPAGSAL